MAVFENEGTAINTKFIISVSDIRSSSNTQVSTFHVHIMGRDGFTARYTSPEVANADRKRLLDLISQD